VAIRYPRTGSSDLVKSTAPFNHNAAYTVFLRVKGPNSVGDYMHAFHVGLGDVSYAGNTDLFGIQGNGQQFMVGCAGGASDDFPGGFAYLTPSTTEYWMAMVRESATSIKWYFGTDETDGTLVYTSTVNVGSRAAADTMTIGGFAGLNWSGDICSPRIWTRALTLVQLHAEAAVSTPADLSNIYTAPAFTGANMAAAVLDTSGAGRNWTAASANMTVVSMASESLPAGGGGSTTVDLAANAQAQALATAALSGGSGPATVDVGISALDFAVNNAAGSDARLMFVGSNLPPRTEFTISGSVYWKAQTDYTGLIAFFSDLGSGNWSGGAWEALFCPHNNDGTYDADGDFLAGSPTLRHFEIGGRKRDADSVSRDTISSPASPGPQGSLITTANEWTVFIFRCTQVGSDLIYTLQPDIRNHPDFKIVSPSVAADIGSTPATPAFSIGAFKWSGNGSTNPEAPGARVRGLRIIGAHADDADALAEALAGERGTNAWETSFGAANGWYINDNPTVADITDKSGAGHTPVWDNAQRPADYSGTLTVPAVGVAVDMAAAGTAQATATATLLKGVSLSGAGLAVAGGSASMSHVVPLAASAVAAAVAGGQLALAVQLSGAAIASAAASAGMSLAVPLAADGAAQAGASAELSTNASVDLAANAQAAASASAVLSLTVSLSAAAVGQALASAALAKAVALGADGAAQADGAAGLQVGAGTDLAADAAAQASAGASLWLDVPLGADALAQALAGGSLSLAVLLGADALSSASGSAAMAADVQLSADGQVIAMATAGLQVTGPISSYLKGFLARPPERTWTAVPPERSFTARPPARI
jgi:hypothetical protein